MKKAIFSIALAVLFPFTSLAQNDNSPAIEEMSIKGRVGYEYQGWEGMTSNDRTGFKGQYVYFSTSGRLGKTLSFEYRQRLDNIGSNVSFFDAAELLSVRWDVVPFLHLSTGKQLVALGGFENNTPTIDMYYGTEFWNQFNNYQYGASVEIDLGKHDNIILQGCNSPLRKAGTNHLYSGNLMWKGHHGFYSSYWSFNMHQYKYDGEKKWMNYVALGNRFNIGSFAYIDIDAMHRTNIDDIKYLKDYTVSAEVSVRPIKQLRAYAKITRDCNEEVKEDMIVTPGTVIKTVSGGLEYHSPLHRAGDVTAFVNGMYSWGDNTNATGSVFEKELRVEAGVKIDVDILGAFKSMR